MKTKCEKQVKIETEFKKTDDSDTPSIPKTVSCFCFLRQNKKTKKATPVYSYCRKARFILKHDEAQYPVQY